jgi:flagellar biosynthesis anti-sigma factor FlgM
MSSINGLGGVNPLQQTASVAKSAATTASSAGSKPTMSDRLELSGASGFLQALKVGGDFRTDKVATIKSQIEAGTYETDDKIDGAADKLLDALGE